MTTIGSADRADSLLGLVGEFEKLTYDAALRGLDKQEGLLEELRTRTGVLLAASSLAASFLGQQAFRDPDPRGLAISALVAFVVSIGASLFILLPKKNLVFAETGAGLYEGLYAVRDDMPEVYRQLAYELDRFWDSNDKRINWLTRVFTGAASALVVEILSLATLLGDNIL
jgi:hypothetical protein